MKVDRQKQYQKDVREHLGESPTGRRLLDYLVEIYVMRPNRTADPVIEGQRILALELRDMALNEREEINSDY